jgi:ATP-dependent RNA helicase DDX24/MAK5
MGFHSPTPIQASTLAASILGQRDIVGAAPTGSGKTLGYLLPILHTLMTEEDDMNDNERHTKRWPLTALVLCPTRELAMQVSNECNRLINLSQVAEEKSSIKCETIVGGLSEQKQKRVLDIKRPAVLVCTPGRLWDLLSSGDHEHLNELKYLRFLVIDEADRMVSQGNFPQLSKIFEKIQQANPSLSYLEANAVEDDEDSDDEDRLLGLPGVKGEAKVQMLDENILKMIEAQRSGKPMKDESDDESNEDDSGNDSDEGDNDSDPEPMEMDDDEYEAEQARIKKELEDSLNVNFEDEEDEEESVKRQTFIFSATLSLPPSTHYNIKSQSKNNKKGMKSVDGAIAEIMEKVGAQGQVKVVDLSTNAGDEKKTKEKKNKADT